MYPATRRSKRPSSQRGSVIPPTRFSVSAPGGTLKPHCAQTNQSRDADLRHYGFGERGFRARPARSISSASQWQFVLNGTIDASARWRRFPRSYAGGYFNLSVVRERLRKDFSGSDRYSSGSGNLMLAAGERLDAQNVGLTAEGGLVDISGTIDVSGINGGRSIFTASRASPSKSRRSSTRMQTGTASSIRVRRRAARSISGPTEPA